MVPELTSERRRHLLGILMLIGCVQIFEAQSTGFLFTNGRNIKIPLSFNASGDREPAVLRIGEIKTLPVRRGFLRISLGRELHVTKVLLRVNEAPDLESAVRRLHQLSSSLKAKYLFLREFEVQSPGLKFKAQTAEVNFRGESIEFAEVTGEWEGQVFAAVSARLFLNGPEAGKFMIYTGASEGSKTVTFLLTK